MIFFFFFFFFFFFPPFFFEFLFSKCTADHEVLSFDETFTNEEKLRERLFRMISAQTEDICFSLAGSPRNDSVLGLSRFVIGLLFGPGQTLHSVSYLEVAASNDAVRDLFGSSGGAQVTGIRVTSASQTVDLLHQFAPAEISSGSNIVLTASRVVEARKYRVHLTFGGPGVWEEAVVNGTSMLAKLSSRCVCVRIANIPNSDFAKEWRRLYPQSVAAAVTTAAASHAASHSVDAETLRNALARIAELEDELAETKRKLQIRENTLVNVLIGSHPAFQDLADYPRRAGVGVVDKENGRSNNHVEFHSSVPLETSGLAQPSSTKKHATPAMLRKLSSTSASGGGAVRVAKAVTPSATKTDSKSATPSATKKSTSILAPVTSGSKPGVKKPVATPGPPKSRSRVF